MDGAAPEGAAAGGGKAAGREVFRPPRWLRASVAAANVFWVAILVLLAAWRAATPQAVCGAGFFIVLFTLLGLFYGRLSAEVSGELLILRGPAGPRSVRLRDIVQVDVRPGLLQTSYEVAHPRGLLEFTSLLSGHRRLLEIIVQRARLAQLPA